MTPTTFKAFIRPMAVAAVEAVKPRSMAYGMKWVVKIAVVKPQTQ